MGGGSRCHLEFPLSLLAHFFGVEAFLSGREKSESPRVSKRIKMMQRIRLFSKSAIWLLLILLAYVRYFNAFF